MFHQLKLWGALEEACASKSRSKPSLIRTITMLKKSSTITEDIRKAKAQKKADKLKVQESQSLVVSLSAKKRRLRKRAKGMSFQERRLMQELWEEEDEMKTVRASLGGAWDDSFQLLKIFPLTARLSAIIAFARSRHPTLNQDLLSWVHVSWRQ